MRIVVLGWGSLCWERRGLRIRGDWQTDGPRLPIEFARVSASRKGSLTLVLFPRSRRVRVLWTEMNFTTMGKAIENLREAEGTTKDNIGWIDLHNPRNNNCKALRTALDVIKRWARKKNFDAVVWTDLSSNFRKKTKKRFNEDNVIAYLQSLDGVASQKAEEYIRKAPRQTNTRMRYAIEERLGWTRTGNDS